MAAITLALPVAAWAGAWATVYSVRMGVSLACWGKCKRSAMRATIGGMAGAKAIGLGCLPSSSNTANSKGSVPAHSLTVILPDIRRVP